MHFVGFIIRIYFDARSSEHQNIEDSSDTSAFAHALQIRLIIITESVLSSDFMCSNLTSTLPDTYTHN
jgi:hypothetical protein